MPILTRSIVYGLAMTSVSIQYFMGARARREAEGSALLTAGRRIYNAAQLGKPPRLELLNPIAKYSALLCAGLVSIELEDANADPDPSSFCGARALRLQRQSGDQSLGTGEPLRERSQLQSLQSLQLRAEQRRHRPLKARPSRR